MIKGTFKLATDVIEVVVKETDLLFYDINTQTFTTLEGLKFDLVGTIKEHPDLKDNPDWKKIALERLKEHVKTIKTEKEKMGYVKKELTKHGYEALYFQIAGFRPQKFR